MTYDQRLKEVATELAGEWYKAHDKILWDAFGEKYISNMLPLAEIVLRREREAVDGGWMAALITSRLGADKKQEIAAHNDFVTSLGLKEQEA